MMSGGVVATEWISYSTQCNNEESKDGGHDIYRSVL